MPKPPISLPTLPSIPFGTTMTDDALITFGAPVGTGAVSFTDVGYMPVTGVTIGGLDLPAQDRAAGLFLQYTGGGVQHFSATGTPTTADYTSLHFNLVAYTGTAVFGHAADGTPTLSGASNETVVAQGDLISGHVGFVSSGGIAGEVLTSFKVGGVTVGSLDVSISHAASDIGPAANGFTLSGGSLQATFVPSRLG